MKVTISLQAEAEIAHITDFIAIDNQQAAENLNRRLYEACHELVSHPERFAVVEHLETRRIRRCPVDRYSVFYIVRSEDVLVLRVVHSARDYPKLFADETT